MESKEAEKAFAEGTPVKTKVGLFDFTGKITALGVNTCTVKTTNQFSLRNVSIAKVFPAGD